MNGDAKPSPRRNPRRIEYDNRTGTPGGIPSEFVDIVIHFPDRIYGTWWYIDEDDGPGDIEGWYIWVASIGLLGVSRGETVAWATVSDLESNLPRIASRLWKTYTYRG